VKLFLIFLLVLFALVFFGLIRGWIITWGAFTEADLEEMGVKIGRKEDKDHGDHD
jgi:hypothetical protein